MQERLSLEQARVAIIAALAGQRLTVESVSTAELAELHGRTLGETLYAPIALPPFANSSMDGYALRAADLTDGKLMLQGAMLAGAHAMAGASVNGVDLAKLLPKHCVRVTTGAALPVGADCVIMQEQCLIEDQYVRFNCAATPGAFVRHAGEDFEKGQMALRIGTRLGAAEIVLVHAFGLRTVRVYARPRVLVLAGGDELKAAGDKLSHGQIYECNRASLSVMIAALGAHVISAPIMPDSKSAIASALASAVRTADLVISTGGASVGEADFLPNSVREMGHVHFYRVRIKPGMPVLFGEINGKPVLSLPGNPVSVFITFLMLAKPAVEMLCGREPTDLAPFSLELSEPIHKTHTRREFVRAVLVRSPLGVTQLGVTPPSVKVRALEGQGSAMLRALVQADGLIDLPEGECELPAGTRVAYLAFRGLLD